MRSQEELKELAIINVKAAWINHKRQILQDPDLTRQERAVLLPYLEELGKLLLEEIEIIKFTTEEAYTSFSIYTIGHYKANKFTINNRYVQKTYKEICRDLLK